MSRKLYHLGRHLSVLQIDMFAILNCIEASPIAKKAKHVLICSDSQAAFKALKGNRVTLKLVWEYLKADQVLVLTGCSNWTKNSSIRN